jgi:hypothetical protein
MKIMSLIFSRLPALFLGLVTIFNASFAQIYTEDKNIVRSFPVNPETRLDISNKYGKIQVIQWKKDSVRLEIELSVKSSSQSKLEKIMDNIEIEFTGTNYYVIANTKIGSTNNTFFTDLMDLSGTIIPSKNKVEINYTVMAPSYMIVNLTNKFGNIYMDDMNGNVTVSLSNGDIKINRLEGEANINVNFGNGTINYLNNANLNLSYADFEIKNAGQLSLISKSSKIRIDKVDILKTESGRDKYSISEINNLFGESYFSDLQIYKLNEEANFTSRYGDIIVDSVASNFSYINLHSEYADLDLTFSQSSSYYMEVSHHPEATLRTPEYFTNLEKKTESSAEIRVIGRIGNPNSSSRLEITAPKKCTITINQRKMQESHNVNN